MCLIKHTFNIEQCHVEKYILMCVSIYDRFLPTHN
jgi:hypothetical protein